MHKNGDGDGRREGRQGQRQEGTGDREEGATGDGKEIKAASLLSPGLQNCPVKDTFVYGKSSLFYFSWKLPICTRPMRCACMGVLDRLPIYKLAHSRVTGDS